MLHFRHTVDVKMLNFPHEYKPNDLQHYNNYLISAGALMTREDIDFQREQKDKRELEEAEQERLRDEGVCVCVCLCVCVCVCVCV